MNVEQKPIAASQGQAASSAPGKAKAAGNPDEAATGGFGSVLAALDEDGDEDEAPDAASQGQPAAQDAVAAPAVTSPAATASAAAVTLPPPGPSGRQTEPLRAGAGAVVGAAVGVVASNASGAVPPWAASMQWLQDSLNPASRPGPDTSAVGPTDGPVAQGDAQAPLTEANELSARPGVHPGAPGSAHGWQVAPDEPGRAVPASPGRIRAEQLHAAADALRAAQANGATDTSPLLPARDDAQVGARADAGRLLEKIAVNAAVGAAGEQALTPQAVAPVRAEHRAETSADSSGRPGAAAGWNQIVGAASAEADGASAAAGSPLDEAGRQLAEQVSYWVSHDVQNAEIKLDKFGRDPVEVSISLQGTQARVEFRTDAPEMREVLQSATAQLKDMLQDQGLSLAGVSVGASGAGASDRRAPNGERPVVRQALVAVPGVQAPVAAVARSGLTTGRALDIFV